MIPIIWFASIVATWWMLVIAARQPAPDESTELDKPNTESTFGQRFGIGMLLAIPPTILWAVCNFVLMQAAPTVQFNAGSEYAMDLWSFWVHAWAPLFRTSIFLCVVYTISSIAIACFRRKPFLALSICALAASGIACLVLRFTFPSA